MVEGVSMFKWMWMCLETGGCEFRCFFSCVDVFGCYNLVNFNKCGRCIAGSIMCHDDI